LESDLERKFIKGLGCSKGKVQGKAIHVFSLKESYKLNDGDILVTYSTNPGWTPLFTKAAGVITEIGGMLSHTATIAREYEIPMITGIENIKFRIPDGATVDINGSSGFIKVLS